MKKEIKGLLKAGSLLAIVTTAVAFGSTSALAAGSSSIVKEGKELATSKKGKLSCMPYDGRWC